MASFGSSDTPKPNVDPELQDFLMAENERARLSAQIHEFTDICWDKCVEKPSNKLDSRTETCLANCMPSEANAHRLLMVSCGSMVLLLLTLLSVSGASGSLQYMETSSQRKAHYCGAKLSDTLAELCNRFNGLGKKSDKFMMPSHEAHLLDDVQNDMEELRKLQDRSSNMIYQALLTLQHLNSHEHNFRRVRRQKLTVNKLAPFAIMSSTNGAGTGIFYMLQALVLLWTIAVVSANKRYCGAELVKVLSFLCDEFPDLHTSSKKAMDTFMKTDVSNDEWMNSEDNSQQQQQQQQMMLDQQLQSVGMVDDRASVPAWMNMLYPSNYMYRHGAGHNELIPARFRKSRGGIVEECCLRPCGMSQLLHTTQKMIYPRYTSHVSVACLFVLIAAGSLQPVTAKRYCGVQLARALAMLCVEYYSLDDLRKNTVGVHPNELTSQFHWSGENSNENEYKRNFNMAPKVDQLTNFEAMDVNDWTSQWFKKKPFHRFIVPHIQARVRRNAADECCQNDCNMSQLLEYCKVVAPGVLPD
uniref:Insulin-like domain-containing protein n=1 Tax=Anopheles minimus TaxID=112268 RepID=A0A182W2H6_9DIPT